MAVRYQCNLSPAALEKAVRELNEPEDNTLRLQAIDRLRASFLKDVKDPFVRTDDAFLLRFLRFRKFREDRALRALKNYRNIRKTWRKVFDLVDDPRRLDKFLDVGSVVPLKERARDGSFVSVACPGRNFGKDYGMTEFFAVTVLTTETLLENEEMQIYGVTVIEDLYHFSIALALQMAVTARAFMNLMQDALPIRIKSLNVTNEWKAFDVIYAVIRPFMSEKLRSRMRLHGSDMKTLSELVDPKILPAFLKGTGPDQDVGWWKEELLKSDA